MNDLMTLWKSRVGAILGIVLAGGTDHREVASMAAQVEADYHGRFIVELLQNASDQATEAGLVDSCITIIRTAELVAFTNEGIEFKEEGLRSITSLGLSTKRPQDAIGNKGIGFKSVFQVSESPEIYSSPSSSESFADAQGLMFKLSLTPLADPSLEGAIREMVNNQLAEKVPVNVPFTVDQVMAEIKAAAPFKFPLPLSRRELSARLAELPEVPNGQTMILLPLRQTPEATKTVGQAIDELFEEAGAAILFLPSVSKIKIIDTEREFTRTISRQHVTAKKQIEGLGQVSTVVTSVREDGTIKERSWRLIERRMGMPDVVPAEQAAREAENININARKLPGTNWDTVHSSPIGVAIPLQTQIAAGESLLLGSRGRVCIGLPTKDPTGTPAWVNAHFHGTISRKGTDLKENSYNELLFGEAVRLHEALIADLKDDPDVHIRRTATLAFEHWNGPLADVLYASDGQARGNVILSVDGKTFQTPSDTVLPPPADVDALLFMVPQTRDLEGFGLKLPDVELTRNARSLIEALIGGKPDSTMVAALLLDRSRNSVSVMEYAAQVRRADGPMFWETFLLWVVGRFAIEQLSDQRLLPVGKDAVAKPSERVFLPPSPRRSAEALVNDDDEIAEVPNDLAESLKFLDDTAVAVRKAGLRSLTELAGKLAPDTGRGLVRSPRLDHLINDAVGPLMQELKEDEASKQNGIRLLRQAMHWLWALSETGRERLTRDALRVPALDAGGSWMWIRPSMTYFGRGWFGEPTDALLHESYGHELERLLLPWESFSSSFGVSDEDRDAWIGALELLGVSRSPKLIRPRDRRPASLVSNRYTELSIDYSPCPIAKAEQFWRPYLEYTRRRQARTASGQRFDFRSITWIDGLERDETRPTILKLMLLYPESYESETSTFLERQYRQNDDSTDVPSLWVYAITANAWKMIPTQQGPAAVADAWLLDGQQRGLARRRLALLNQVEAPYDDAKNLLHGIGVTTLQTASVSRLLYAIGHLGESCADYDAETGRTVLALAEDLFSHLQVAYSKSPTALPDLKSFCFPMERNRVASGIRGDEILTGYVNDDPMRAGFISSFSEAFIWPLDLHHAYRDLVNEIRRQLGESAVVFTSEASVESRFKEYQSLKRKNLLEWLSTRFPQHSVASNLACLIAYTGRVETDPNGEEFKRNWRSFERAYLVFGEFPADSPTPYFYDRSTGLLQVSADLSDPEKVEATWMLVGPSYRDTWSAYARELERDSPGKFLTDRRITSAQRENVENVIGLSSSERFNHLRAAALALWFVRFGKEPISRFKEEWNAHARSVRGLCDWLGRPELADTVAAGLGLSEEEASLAIIRVVGIDSQEWQQARLALGMERWSFSYKIKAWNDTITELVSILKTCVARAVSISPAELEPILRDPRLAAPPEEIAYKAEGDSEVLHATFRQIEVILNDRASVAGVDFLQRRLAVIVDQAKASLATVNLDDAPTRDVRVYRDEDKYEEKRSRDAQIRFDGLMVVASALAKQLNEQITAEDVRRDPRVSQLLHGWWANSFTAMAAVQRVFQAKVPKTAQRMSDQRVFRDPAPANELLARFNELAGVGGVEPVALPKHRITIFGQDQTEDAAATDLLRGTIGDIGKQLKEKAALHPLDSNLGKGVREKIVLPSERAKARGGGSSGATQANKKDRELAGLLGEAFVYEYFRTNLPAFDEMAWRSCNRNAYGLEGEGNDSLGFDFSYQDNENLLAGRQDRPLCFIEVKSSSGDGSEPFQMTANEWEKARYCHQTTDSVYIILRVSHVRDNPMITDVIIDPFGLYGAGQVGVVSRDMWVYVGASQSVSDTANDLKPPDSPSESA